MHFFVGLLRLFRIFGMLIFRRWVELLRHSRPPLLGKPTHSCGARFLRVAASANLRHRFDRLIDWERSLHSTVPSIMVAPVVGHCLSVLIPLPLRLWQRQAPNDCRPQREHAPYPRGRFPSTCLSADVGPPGDGAERVGPPRGRPISDPDPADRLAADASAADLIQRPYAGVVS
jgi:hypothetical protein